ncbi:MAG: 3-hydroxyacyl-CoA dehydrogenase NAD-binding domain-containing protein [Rhodothermales bacterium]
MNGHFLRTERDDELVIWWLDQRDDAHNKLSTRALDEIGQAIDEAKAEPDVRGIVVLSAKADSFIVGADVREIQAFSSRDEAAALSRTAHALIERVRGLDIPIVAGIHGPAIGGGLEFALACTMRIATDHPATTFSLPEVKLGLLPGGGGTQFLPRLIGIQQSLPMLLTGKNVYPRPARRMGLVDELIHRPGLATAAKAAARALITDNRKVERGKTLQERVLEGNPLTRRIIYRKASERVDRQTRGNYPAPIRIIECVRAGIEDGLEEGLRREAEAFADLAMTPESRELVRLFFAKNDAERNPLSHEARTVRAVGVLGAGLMGSGIAGVTAENGLDVVVKDRSLELAAASREHVFSTATRKVKKGAMSRFERDVVVERVTATGTYDAFKGVDLVIEAAPEDEALKKQLIRDVEQVVGPDCIFASNTSSIPISDLAEASSRPDRVIGMHYFSPVPKVPLLEIIRTEQTPDWVLATAIDVGLAQGKTVIVVSDGHGFYTTRILALYMNEALDLLVDGADIESVDRAMRNFGFPMGPYEIFDLVGLDVASKITHVMEEIFSRRGYRPNRRADEMVDAGWIGQKSNRGFYSYEKGKKKEVNDDAYRFFREHAAQGRVDFSEDEIQHRLALTLVNEAARCLEDGILHSAVDGDVGAVFGLGFPPFLGGPFRYVDREGPDQVVARLDLLADRHGPQFSPASDLRRMADEGRTYY